MNKTNGLYELMADSWQGDLSATLCVRTLPSIDATAVAASFSTHVDLSLRAKRGKADPHTGLRGGIAFVVFADEQAADAALSVYDGRCGAAAKAFQPSVPEVVHPGGLGWAPSLQSQLEPLTLAQLRERINRLDPAAWMALEPTVDRTIAAKGLVAGKCLLVDHMCSLHCARPRQRRQAHGVLVEAHLCAKLLAALRATQWGPKERRVIAQQYLTIRRPWIGASRKADSRCRQGMQKHRHIWEAAASVIESVAPAGYEYTSLAVTANFQGSPHRDLLDQSHQFAISLGNFGAGGRLCVETADDEITCIDTHERMACIDGRFTHWVDGYEGERYSVIYYTVDSEHFTEPRTALPLPEFAVRDRSFSTWYSDQCCA